MHGITMKTEKLVWLCHAELVRDPLHKSKPIRKETISYITLSEHTRNHQYEDKGWMSFGIEYFN